MFAYAFHHPVWYLGADYAVSLQARSDWDTNGLQESSAGQCEAASDAQILRALEPSRLGTYDGLLIVASPHRLDQALLGLRKRGMRVERRAPGMAVIPLERAPKQ
jgi:hypothetical protein